MYSIGSILSLATLLSVVLASPTPTATLQKRSFYHHVRRQTDFNHPMAGPNAMLKAYKKFGFNLRTRTVRGNSTGSTGQASGNVGAIPEANAAEYLSPVTIGGQTVQLDFDTGSSDLWVFSTALSKNTIGSHGAFNPAKSKAFQAMTGSTWSISYGDGSGAAGTVGMDEVTIGGVTATSQAVELATAVSQSFVRDVNNDGLVGLAFSNLNTVKPQKQKTFFDTVMPQLAMPVFSVDLTNDAQGSYLFGAIDKSKFTGQLTDIPVRAETGFWAVESKSYTIGTQRVQNPTASPAIADTGTSLLLVDQQVADAYYAQVKGAVSNPQIGGYTYPCNAQMPDFGVALGPQYMAIVPGNQLTFAQVDANTCFGGVQGNGGANLQIYGDVMFRAQYVVFDGEKKQLRVAPKVTNTSTAAAVASPGSSLGPAATASPAVGSASPAVSSDTSSAVAQ